MVIFLLLYYVEVKQRLYSGIQLDPTLKLLPAWKRLQEYDTPFINPPVLRGMLGTKSQVDSLNRLHEKITSYISIYPTINLINKSSWDYLAGYFLEKSVVNNELLPLLLNDTPDRPEGYKLLSNETIYPSFAYQLTNPGKYYLYSPIDYSIDSVSAKYHLRTVDSNKIKDLENFPITTLVAEVKIEFKNNFKLDSISIVADGGLGSWTTRPIYHLWGVGIFDQYTSYNIINNGKRTEELRIPINSTLKILIPDNGSLSKCPILKINLATGDNNYLSTKAVCSESR